MTAFLLVDCYLIIKKTPIASPYAFIFASPGIPPLPFSRRRIFPESIPVRRATSAGLIFLCSRTAFNDFPTVSGEEASINAIFSPANSTPNTAPSRIAPPSSKAGFTSGIFAASSRSNCSSGLLARIPSACGVFTLSC